MAGLLGSTVGTTKKQDLLEPGKMLGYDPMKRDVEENELVSGQMNALLATESPFITRARTSAAQAANARGLLNSSIAAGAGEAAAIDSALPIAVADAGTFNAAKRDNQQVENQALQFSASESNQAGRMQMGAGLERGLQELRGEQALGLADVEGNYRSLIQASSNASGMYQDSVRAISAIMADPTTDAGQKQAAVDKTVQLLKSGLTIVGRMANVDISSLLDFSV